MAISHADTGQPQPLLLTSTEHGIWIELRSRLEITLNSLQLAHLLSPSMLLLRDYVEGAVGAMHRKVFLQLAMADFGMVEDTSAEYLEGLYKAEMAEHGSQNIAQYCRENDWLVAVTFPQEADTIVSIITPARWNLAASSTARLVEALGYEWHEHLLDAPSEGCVLTLRKSAGKVAPVKAARVLDKDGNSSDIQRIHEKLGYGLIQFSSAGEIVALSEAMLASVKLPVSEESIALLAGAIPFNFYNDIIWGLALSGHDGVFENYRTRMRISGNENLSILFNVSGYRDEQLLVHSLWQIVSLEEGASNLAEGSILSEARIHKITRNYVPQLVEEKAREAVRLGKDKLANEECFVAVLFCDIVGFTSYVESNASSESVINTLNTILRRVSSSVKRHNGHIDKFMGDSVMAIFRNPADAVFAALDMQSHSADINGLRSRAGQDTLRLRIGIHWGEVVIGNVGTAERLDWTAIGDVVNTASRIEKNCNPGSILISQAMRDAIVTSRHREIIFGDVFQIMVKGKREALPVCHITPTNK